MTKFQTQSEDLESKATSAEKKLKEANQRVAELQVLSTRT